MRNERTYLPLPFPTFCARPPLKPFPPGPFVAVALTVLGLAFGCKTGGAGGQLPLRVARGAFCDRVSTIWQCGGGWGSGVVGKARGLPNKHGPRVALFDSEVPEPGRVITTWQPHQRMA
jgi:hypothetical protein